MVFYYICETFKKGSNMETTTKKRGQPQIRALALRNATARNSSSTERKKEPSKEKWWRKCCASPWQQEESKHEKATDGKNSGIKGQRTKLKSKQDEEQKATDIKTMLKEKHKLLRLTSMRNKAMLTEQQMKDTDQIRRYACVLNDILLHKVPSKFCLVS